MQITTNTIIDFRYNELSVHNLTFMCYLPVATDGNYSIKCNTEVEARKEFLFCTLGDGYSKGTF